MVRNVETADSCDVEEYQINGPSYCVVGMMRSGSNYLQSLLHNHSELVCYGEIFNKGVESKYSPLNIDDFINEHEILSQQKLDIFFEALSTKASATTWGFRIFEGHNDGVLRSLINDPSVKVIVLKRNLLQAYCSLYNAQKSGQWRLAYEHKRKPALSAIEVNLEQFLSFCIQQMSFYNNLMAKLAEAKKTPFLVDYDDLVDTNHHFGDLEKFLGLNNSLDRKNVDTMKQIRIPIEDLVVDYDDLVDRLSQLGVAHLLLN